MKCTVSYYEFQEALRELQMRISPDYSIRFHDMSAWGEKKIQIGVNWASIGTVPAADAVAFAKKISEAAAAAESFIYNGYEIVYGGDEQC